MKEIEADGKTVTMAVENGLAELGLRRDQVEVEVIQEGNAGFLGIGAKPALVRLREKIWSDEKEDGAKRAKKPAPEKPHARKKNTQPQANGRSPKAKKPEEETIDTGKACAATQEVLGEVLRLAQLPNAQVRCAWDAPQCRVCAQVESSDAGLLIGQGGRTIEALQFLVTIIVGRKTGTPTAIQVETQGYWKKIEGKVLAEAESAVEEVKRSGEAYRFDPLEASLRRLIHRKLADHPDVVTTSEGEGAWRKVVIKPRRGK